MAEGAGAEMGHEPHSPEEKTGSEKLSSLTEVMWRIPWGARTQTGTPDCSYSFQMSPQKKLLTVQLSALWK